MACLTSRQLSEWIAYDALEPFGELRADFRAGQIAATVANVHRGRNDDPYRPDDFLPALAEGRTSKRGEPLQLDDPVAQAELIKRTFLGST